MKEEIKESFCPVCIAAVPLAFSGITAGLASQSDGEDDRQYAVRVRHHRNKKIMWIAILIGIISLSVIIYFKFIKKCESCR